MTRMEAKLLSAPPWWLFSPNGRRRGRYPEAVAISVGTVAGRKVAVRLYLASEGDIANAAVAISVDLASVRQTVLADWLLAASQNSAKPELRGLS
jgi:hypothetical protein